MSEIVHGSSPDTHYRVSLKAIIRNEQGDVLLVRENGDTWNFPGGGIEHGESEMDALKRELGEEIAVSDEFEARALGIDSFFVESKNFWLMWVIYEITFPSGFSYGIGSDADEVAFIDPRSFEGSDELHAHHIYKWAIQKSPH